MENQNTTRVVLLACMSVNPIHYMHLRMFELARDHLEDTGRYRVERGIISPVGDGRNKEGLIEACHRVEMASLATESSDWIFVDSWESLQPESVVTAEVIRHHYEELVTLEQSVNNADIERSAVENSIEGLTHHGKRGDLQLMLLCGADLLESFADPNLWKPKDIAEIVGHYGLVCIIRSGGGSDPHKLIHRSHTLWEHRKNIHVVNEWIANEISSAHVRRALHRGRSAKYLLPESVLRYIQQHRLYGSEREQKKEAGAALSRVDTSPQVLERKKHNCRLPALILYFLMLGSSFCVRSVCFFARWVSFCARYVFGRANSTIKRKDSVSRFPIAKEKSE